VSRAHDTKTHLTMSETTKEPEVEEFNILEMFANEASSSELDAAVHENVRLVDVDISTRKDGNGNAIKKQLFLKFKKYDENGEDIGEKEISFFKLDPTRESVINNLATYLLQTKEILELYLEPDAIKEAFDPLRALWNEDTMDEKDFGYDSIKKKVLKKAAAFKAIEEAISSQFLALIKDHIGYESEYFRFKLVESNDAKYIEIPRFDRFVERASIERKNSNLLNN